MNPLGNGNLNKFNNTLSPQMMQGIQQVKSMMHMANGNPTAMLQQIGQNNPMVNQVLQMYKGQNLQNVFMNECKRMGVDPNAILNELRR